MDWTAVAGMIDFSEISPLGVAVMGVLAGILMFAMAKRMMSSR